MVYDWIRSVGVIAVAATRYIRVSEPEEVNHLTRENIHEDSDRFIDVFLSLNR